MTMWSQRARVARPPKGESHDNLFPIEEKESGDLEAERQRAEGGVARRAGARRRDSDRVKGGGFAKEIDWAP